MVIVLMVVLAFITGLPLGMEGERQNTLEDIEKGNNILIQGIAIQSGNTCFCKMVLSENVAIFRPQLQIQAYLLQPIQFNENIRVGVDSRLSVFIGGNYASSSQSNGMFRRLSLSFHAFPLFDSIIGKINSRGEQPSSKKRLPELRRFFTHCPPECARPWKQFFSAGLFLLGLGMCLGVIVGIAVLVDQDSFVIALLCACVVAGLLWLAQLFIGLWIEVGNAPFTS